MRRLVAIVVAAIALAGCSGGERPSTGERLPDLVDERGDLSPELASFLADIAAPGTVAFDATYSVTQKLGGVTTMVRVSAAPPAWRVEAGDVVVVDGPRPATCRPSLRRCVGEVLEAQVTQFGVPSTFFSTATHNLLATAARRPGAGAMVHSTRTLAGVELRCAAVPIGAATPALACITAEGVVGFEEDPSRVVTLTAYQTGAPADAVTVPFALVEKL